jgi:hypothetical protein
VTQPHPAQARGQTLVEWALMLPLALLLILSITTFGLAYHHRITLEYAVQEAARRGVVGATDAQIEAMLRHQTPSLRGDALRWRITPPDTSLERAQDHPLTVEAWYEEDLPFPLPGLLPRPLILYSRAQVRIEVFPAVDDV